MTPITVCLLRKLYRFVDVNDSFHVCMWSLMLFMFFTFVRKSNVLPLSPDKFDSQVQLCCRDIVCNGTHLSVTLGWSKTIQFGQRKVIIPVSSITGSSLCPVQAYVNLRHMVPSSPQMSPFTYIGQNGSVQILTYPVFVSQLRRWLDQLGLDSSLYCTHSFRRGGATFAFQCSVDPQLIKAQGDWSSDCYLKYVSLSTKQKLCTTRRMAHNIANTSLD